MASLSIRRGDTRVWTLAFRNFAGAPQSLSGLTIWWSVKPSAPALPGDDLTDATAIMKAWWQHSGGSVVSSGVTGPDGASGGSFVSASPASGQMTLTLLPRLTTSLPTPAGGATWKYDIQIQFAADDLRTWDEGSVGLVPDITRRVTVP